MITTATPSHAMSLSSQPSLLALAKGIVGMYRVSISITRLREQVMACVSADCNRVMILGLISWEIFCSSRSSWFLRVVIALESDLLTNSLLGKKSRNEN